MQNSADISSTVDGFFFGFVVSAVLLGFTLVQGWAYVLNNNDKWPVKIFVAVVVTLDISETCCSTALLRYYLVTHFGDFEVFLSYPKALAADFAITGIIVFLVQMFFASRLLLLGKSRWYVGVIVVCTLAMLGICASILISQGQTDLLVGFGKMPLKIQMAAFHIIGVIVDALITFGLSMTFSPRNSTFRTTKMILHQLLMYSITRGILITLVQIGHVTMYLVDSTNMLFWISFHLTVSKTYVITTLVILNMRTARREKPELEESGPRMTMKFMHSSSTLENASESQLESGTVLDSIDTEVGDSDSENPTS